MTNIILATDSYKLTHHNMYDPGVRRVHSYLEAREGAAHSPITWFGLQAIIQEYLTGPVVTTATITEASLVAKKHFRNGQIFNADGWVRIRDEHFGRLPVEIKALPEGTLVKPGDTLMTIENTDPRLPWLTNALESLLLHVWYPTTVASVTGDLVRTFRASLEKTGADPAGAEYMLHDFGYRGVSSHESATIGGLAHLVHSRGTDTLPALLAGLRWYDADLGSLGNSVRATEHSIMTQRGADGEPQLIDYLIMTAPPRSILSIVSDSYNYYNTVKYLLSKHKAITAAGLTLVIRPDSLTSVHSTPESLVLWTLQAIAGAMGTEATETGFNSLKGPFRVLWGDGLSPDGIKRVLKTAELHGFSTNALIFGMGGGLLQKVNRDTERFAIKASAMEVERVDGLIEWVDVQKNPLDGSKKSKAGRQDAGLELVYRNGSLVRRQSFADIRRRASG